MVRSRQLELLMADTDRLRLLREMSPDFAQAEFRNERWATDRAEMVRGIDGKASRRHPERSQKEDGEPRNWCGSCLHPEGCVSCDLDGSHEVKKWAGAAYRTN